MTAPATRDHGGGIDAAMARHGGNRAEWLDLSTGINPSPYPVSNIEPGDWYDLPDSAATERLLEVARTFWSPPDQAAILAAPGASALIARIPALRPVGAVRIDGPTYNEHEAAFRAHGWEVGRPNPSVRVVVHPNNPTGTFWNGTDAAELTIIDESFCDCTPEQSRVSTAGPGVIVLKSFGKFWGLAGLRLGFAIGASGDINRLAELLGPWPVAGPALRLGARALEDHGWISETRERLRSDAQRLDAICGASGFTPLGGTDLFRLYDTPNASALRDQLARHHIWSRIFPYSDTWIRLGMPGDAIGWARLEQALKG